MKYLGLGILAVIIPFTIYIIFCYFKDIYNKFKKKPTETPAAESPVTDTEAQTPGEINVDVEEIKTPEPVLMESDENN